MTALMISLSLLLLVVGSCSTSPQPVQSTSSAHPKAPWSLELKTTGGFIGSGKGNIVVDSEGKCTYWETNREQVKSSVTGTLYPRGLQPISDAVAKLELNGWNIPGLNVAAPDAFGYKLEFRTGPELKEVTPIQWYDNTAGLLPEDLKRLTAALEQAMKSRCGGAP